MVLDLNSSHTHHFILRLRPDALPMNGEMYRHTIKVLSN